MIFVIWICLFLCFPNILVQFVLLPFTYTTNLSLNLWTIQSNCGIPPILLNQCALIKGKLISLTFLSTIVITNFSFHSVTNTEVNSSALLPRKITLHVEVKTTLFMFMMFKYLLLF